MKIVGNSRAKVEIITSGDGYLVKKTCTGLDALRLVGQLKKQENFQYPGIRTPLLTSIDFSNESCEATMEFISGLDFVTFTSQACYNDFENAINKIAEMIRSEFKNSNMTKFPKEKWLEKVDSVIKGSKKNSVSSDLLEMISAFLTDSIPDMIEIGNCHGDLTFSNVIVERDGTVCLFDFLDPPITTPYEDVSKLLQDVEFFWTLKKYQGVCDETRVRIMWSYSKNLILENLKDFLDLRVLAMFQVMTLMRIIPYTHEESTIEYLIECILRKIYETNFTLWR